MDTLQFTEAKSRHNFRGIHNGIYIGKLYINVVLNPLNT